MKWIFVVMFMLSFGAFSEELAVTTPSTVPSKIETKSEAEIPVHLDNNKKQANAESPWFRMLMAISVAGILSAGAWVLVRKAKTKAGEKEVAPQIKVLTQHHLGPKKSLAIIRVAGESILIGVTDQNISLIKELSLLDEDIPTNVPQNFKESLEDAEDFSMSGIKDFVSARLKNMRTIQ